MKNNTTKLITALVSILTIGSIAVFIINNNSQTFKDTKTQSSKLQEQTTDTKTVMNKMKEEELSTKKISISKTSSSQKTMQMEIDLPLPQLSQIDPKSDTTIKEGDIGENINQSAELASPTGIYSQYSVNNLAQNATGINLIFFCSSSSQSCKTIEGEITNNLDKLPENFQILKADYDTATALKQKYGITNQSTFIKVDKDGNKIGEASKTFALATVADIIAFGQK